MTAGGRCRAGDRGMQLSAKGRGVRDTSLPEVLPGTAGLGIRPAAFVLVEEEVERAEQPRLWSNDDGGADALEVVAEVGMDFEALAEATAGEKVGESPDDATGQEDTARGAGRQGGVGRGRAEDPTEQVQGGDTVVVVAHTRLFDDPARTRLVGVDAVTTDVGQREEEP